jgi:hypothetical protein
MEDKEYILVKSKFDYRDDGLQGLEDRVNQLIAEGYKPIGSPVVHFDMYLIQAMVRE